MADLNKVIIQGRFVRDAETKVAKSGTEFVTFCLACNRIPNKDTGETTADFVDFIAYGNTAKFTRQFFKKGSQALVVGRIQVRNYIDSNEQKRKSVEIVADEVHFCGGKLERNPDGVSGEGDTLGGGTVNGSQNGFTELSNEEDLPF